MSSVIFQTLTCLFLLFLCVCPQAPPFTSSSSRFIDSSGRTVLFHGANVVYKVPPYIPSTGSFDSDLSLVAADIDNMLKWGFNFVRLGVMWEAVETSPSSFDEEYLAEVEELINTLGSRGIFTLVDAHQDVFARTMCGEGVPSFYATYEQLEHQCPVDRIWEVLGLCVPLSTYDFTYDEDGYPLIEECQQRSFPNYYLSPEAISAYDRLYTNSDGLQDRFLDFWAVSSAKFANNDYVIGYDPINEPHVADYFKEPLLIFKDGKFDKEKLQPLYANTFEVYQENAPSKMMFFESAQFPDEIGVTPTVNFVRPLGFTQPPGGVDKSSLQILNDHSYCCQMASTVCEATGEPTLDLAEECLAWHEKRIGTRVQDAQNLGIHYMVTEFGSCTDSVECAQEITQVTETCDQYLLGWAYWQFKTYGDLTSTSGTRKEGFYVASDPSDDTIQDIKTKAIARTYLKATQGILTSMSFDTVTVAFSATFTYQSSVTAPSLLYRSDYYYYPNGYDLALSLVATGEALKTAQYSLDEASDEYVIQITITDEDLDQQEIRIDLTAKANAEQY